MARAESTLSFGAIPSGFRLGTDHLLEEEGMAEMSSEKSWEPRSGRPGRPR